MAAARAGGTMIGWYGKGAQSDLGQLRDAWDAFRKAKPFWEQALREVEGG
jgi:hypothetical protein